MNLSRPSTGIKFFSYNNEDKAKRQLISAGTFWHAMRSSQSYSTANRKGIVTMLISVVIKVL
mgnify:CR=1 FL=1